MGDKVLWSKTVDDKWNEPWMKFGRKVVKMTIDLARLDVQKENTSPLALVQDKGVAGEESDPSKNGPIKRKAFSKMSDAAFVFIVYMSIKISISLCLQNRFNRNCRKLQTIAKSCLDNSTKFACFSDDILHRNSIVCSISPNLHGGPSPRHLELEWEILHQNYLNTKDLLKTIGNPFLYIGSFIECVYIFILVLNIFGYLAGVLVLRKYHGVLFASIRTISFERREIKDVFQMIRVIVNLYISSSRTFLQMSISRCVPAKLLQHIWGPVDCRHSRKNADESLATLKREFRRNITDHELSIKDLSLMASDGRLHPLNLRPENIRSNAITYMKFFATLLVSFIYFASALVIGLVFSNNIQEELRIDFQNLQDWIFLFEFHLMCLVQSTFCCVHLSFPLMICLDQLSYVDQLLIMVQDCQRKVAQFQRYILETQRTIMVRAHSDVAPRRGTCFSGGYKNWQFDGSHFQKSFHSWKQLSLTPVSEQSLRLAEFESNLVKNRMRTKLRPCLLATLMQCKLFAEQFKQVRGIVNLVGYLGFVVVIAFPGTVHLYYPYLCDRMRHVSAGCAIAFTLYVNVSYLPLCDLHRRCVKLIQELAYLVAHLIEVDCLEVEMSKSDTQLDSGPHLSSDEELSAANHVHSQCNYSEDHIVWLLRKELSHPDRLSSQFTLKVGNVALTYGNLIKAYFWLGVLFVPTFLSSSQGVGVSDRIMRFLRINRD